MADINKDEIKLMESQKLDDTDEGGGQMTGTEVVSGAVNNLFPDISRLDRTYGRVSLRKAFLSIRTLDRATYYGAHAVITEQAADPLVGVTMFSTEDWFDERKDARDRIEAYLTRGPQFSARMFSDHYSGTRALNLVMETTSIPPEIGDVLVLVGDKDLTTEFEQYVRVLDVETNEQTFVDDEGEFDKMVVSVEISTALEYDFQGNQPSRETAYGGLSTTIFTVVVANAADYFGVSTLDGAILTNALQLKVDTIFKPIVPASQSSTPLVDFTVNSPRNRLVEVDQDTGEYSISRNFSTASNSQMLIGEPIIPGSLTFHTYYDNGEGGICKADGTIIGGIDYITGTINIGAAGDGNIGVGTWTYKPAMVDTQVAATGSIGVDENNRGFVYVYSCDTLPLPLTMRVAYMASGKWYQLLDVGGGRLSSAQYYDSSGTPVEVADLGTGTINYETGSVSLTLKFQPDIGSNIMISWCDDVDVFEVKETGPTQTLKCVVETQVTWTQPIPGTIVIDNQTNPTYPDIVDTNADGILWEGGTEVGTVNYQTGEIEFNPINVSAGQATYAVTWDEDVTPGSNPDQRHNQTYNLNMPSPVANVITFTIDSSGIPAGEEIVPGTFSLSYPWYQTTRKYRDDGAGVLYYLNTKTAVGTINYATGEVTLNVNVQRMLHYVNTYSFSVQSYTKTS